MNWLEEEIKTLNMERAQERARVKYEKDPWVDWAFLYRLALLGIIFFCAAPIKINTKECPVPVPKAMFPGTWHCNNCGYDNYNGISSCAICGKSRY